jgi:hypothetical protein
MNLEFLVGDDHRRFDPEVAVVAGFTGRDRAEVEAHLVELRELGVPTPSSIPTWYPMPPSLVVQSDAVTTVLPRTSGEAECVLVVDGGDVFVTLGSDHTDRAAESLDIALSKMVCPKPVAAEAWPLTSVAGHLDEIQMTSWTTENGREVMYQQGTLAAMMPLETLLGAVPFAERPTRFVLFTGTLPAIGGIRPGSRFRATLHDPVVGRTIEVAYDVNALEVLVSDVPDEQDQQ